MNFLLNKKIRGIIILIVGIILFFAYAFIPKAGGSYSITEEWGTIQLITLGLIIWGSILLFQYRDSRFTQKERNFMILLGAALLVFYIFPTMKGYNPKTEFVIDDFRTDTPLCIYDYYAEKYPDSTFMVIPNGEIKQELIDKLKELQNKGIKIGSHGYTHFFPEGIIPGISLAGYNRLNKYIKVDAYRQPNYINNLWDWWNFKNKGLSYYAIGYNNAVLHIDRGVC
ncbi:MAG: hypothetical protein AABY22_33320 [Nanoarchaeota archaeon]